MPFTTKPTSQLMYLTEAGDIAAISANDVHQGQLGDCYLLACLCDLAAAHPGVIKNMIQQNADSTETVTLYESAHSNIPAPGQTAFRPVSITVDNAFATNSVNNGASQDAVGSQKEIWVQVLEKAVASLGGGYSSIANGGNPAAAMEQLIGQTATAYSPTRVTADMLGSSAVRGDLVTFDTFGRSDLSYDLVGNHAYAFMGIVDTAAGPAVQLKNPWGFDDPAPVPVSQLSNVFAEVDILQWTASVPRLSLMSSLTGSSSLVDGTFYNGPVQGIANQYDGSTNQGNMAIGATTPNWFIHGGNGNDAIVVTAGTNILDGGAGSNFLVGANGSDGGTDTFFTDARGSDMVWNTLVNFHAGDYATLWGFDPSVSVWHWEGITGAEGYSGATLRADVHGTGVPDASITFAGLSMTQAQGLEVASGSVGGNGYLMFHNPGV